MPLGYLRRPLFLITALYMLILAALHARGVFAVEAAPALLRFRSYPSVRLEGLVLSPAREDSRGEKVFVRAARVEGRAFAQKVLVYLPKNQPVGAIRPGRSLVFEGALRLPRAARNPGEFDERAFLSDRGTAWIMKAERFAPRAGPVAWPWLPAYWAESARRSVQGSFQRLLSEEDARLMTGLAMGYKGPLRRELNRAIQDAGVMHLLVPSGAKQAFVMLACSALASWLGFGVLGRFLFSGLVGGFYVLMVGADPPYARAYLGALALFGGYLLDRHAGAFQATVFSALAILLLDPSALFSAGFQMTYLAMAGLLVAMPGLLRRMPSACPRAVKRLAGALAVTVIVEIMLWPVFANTFGRGSVVGALANAILVPASGGLMALGFAVWGLSLMTEGPLLSLPVWILKAALAAFRWICFKAAALPGAAAALAPMSSAAVIVYYLLVFAALVWPRKRAALALALGAAVLWAGLRWADRPPPLSVVYLRLPAAQAALLTFAGKRRWLVLSGGPAGTVLRALRHYGVSRLDKAVLIGSAGKDALGRIIAEIPAGEVAFEEDSWTVCEKRVCFSFAPPRVRRGNAEFSIIPSRLRRRAVEARTDGSQVRIKNAL